MTTDYKIEVWNRGDTYVAEIRELALVLTDTNIARLAQRAEEEKKRILDEYTKADVPAPRPASPPQDASQTKTTRRNFGLYTAKVAVVAFAASIVLVITADRAIDQMLSAVGGAQGPFHFLSIVAQRLDTLPEAARKKALRDIDVIVREMEPFATKIRPLLDSANSRHGDEANRN